MLNQDIMFEILMLLDFEDVKSICLSNPYTYQLCNNKEFWKRYFKFTYYDEPTTTHAWLSEYSKINKVHKTAVNLLNTVSTYESIRLFFKTNISNIVTKALNDQLSQCIIIPGEAEYTDRNDVYYGYGDFLEINYHRGYNIVINVNLFKSKECRWSHLSYDEILKSLIYVLYHYKINHYVYRNHYTQYEVKIPHLL